MRSEFITAILLASCLLGSAMIAWGGARGVGWMIGVAAACYAIAAVTTVFAVLQRRKGRESE
jgi:hypothetical protein